jgi:hypothetical protein
MHTPTAQPLAFCQIGTNFLRLAEGACDQLAKNSNRLAVVGPTRIAPSTWDERTFWSDFRIGIPVLFNFFHGIELLLKGFLATSSPTPAHHRLSELLAAFEKAFPSTAFGKTVASFVRDIDPSTPLGRFIADNSITIDYWYEALKYPQSTKGKPFSHAALKYGGEATVDFWQSIGQGAALLRRQAVKLARGEEHA